MARYLDQTGLQDYTTQLTAKYKTVFATKGEVGTPLVASTAAAMTDTSKIYVYVGSESGYSSGNWYYYNGSAWVSGGVYNAVAGDVLTNSIDQSFLKSFQKVAWTDENGIDYYTELENSLYGSKTVESVSALFNSQGRSVCENDNLEYLRQFLTVSAVFSDGTSGEINAYTLSGSLIYGNSTITVFYGGQITTFVVPVEKAFLYRLTEKDFAFKTNLKSNVAPYYDTSVSGSPQRYSYVNFDILLEAGKTYEYAVNCKYQTAYVGMPIFNRAFWSAANVSGGNMSSDIYDTGWMPLSGNVTIPETINNSPAYGARFTFKQAESSPILSSDFAVKELIIREGNN